MSQSFYYLENRVSRSNATAFIYHTFLVVEPDGTASARVRYYEETTPDKNHLAELNLIDSLMEGREISSGTRYLVPKSSPVFITGMEDSSFLIPRYLFREQTDSGETYFVPWSVQIESPGKTWEESALVKNQEKSLEELQEARNFVRIFYNEEDEMYQYLYGTNLRAPMPANLKQKIYLISVANTLDSSIGKSSEMDFNNISNTFTMLATRMGIPIVPTYIEGEGFNKNAVLKAIAELRPAPEDIVIFYYSGHGFRYSNDVSRYPRMSFRKNPDENLETNNLELEDVYNQIVKRGARVNLVLSDCCNENIGVPQPVGREILRTRPGITRGPVAALNWETVADLFLPRDPVSILIGSAEVNQLAIGNPKMGGFFTCFFRTELEKSLYGFERKRTWLMILRDAREKARYQALTALCGDNRCQQTAEIRVTPPH